MSLFVAAPDHHHVSVTNKVKVSYSADCLFFLNLIVNTEMISVLVMSILIFLESFDNANFFHEIHKGQAFVFCSKYISRIVSTYL